MADPTPAHAVRALIPRFWKLLLPFRGLMAKALVMIVVMQLLALAEPWMVMFVIDGIAGKHDGFRENLLPITLAMFAMLALIGAAQVVKNRRNRAVCFAIEHDLPIACGRKLLSLPLTYHQTENTGILVGKVVRGIGRCSDVVMVLLWEIVPLVVQTLITTAMLLWFSVPAALVLLPIVMIFGFVTARVKLGMSGNRAARHRLDGAADEKIGQAITNVMTTQAFSQEDREMRAVTAIRDEVNRRAILEFGTYDRSDFLRNGVISLGRAGVIFVCALSAFDGAISMGTLVFVSTLAEKVFVSCYRIGSVFDRLMEAAEPVMRMSDIFEEPNAIVDPARPAPSPNRFKGGVNFENVTFAYKTSANADARRKPALDGITLRVAPGETIGIVGESGGGKSTLVKLLLRFGDPDKGSVTLDGIDLRLLRRDAFRPQIGYVPQEVEIYDGTVAENIAYGRPDATRKDVERAAAIANADGFIAELPHGYEEVVGNRGLRLSGGQRQRIGIARAVLLDPPILVFDEATSHVDTVSERKIHAAIEELRRGKTVIIIAHRLSTVQNADRIVVMNDGRIGDVGTHQQLMSRPGTYRRLVDIQVRADLSA